MNLSSEARAGLTEYEVVFATEKGAELRRKYAEKGEKLGREKENCFIPELGIYMSEYMDIARLFSDKDRFGEFLNTLFAIGFNVKVNEGDSFLFYRKGKSISYIFDYNFILMAIIEWCIHTLGADRSEIMRFMAQFTSTNTGSYQKSNYFLAVTIFSHMYEMNTLPYTKFVSKRVGTKFYLDIKYYTPYIVKSPNGKQAFFRGISFSGVEVLKHISDDTATDIFEKRESLDLKQIEFSSKAIEARKLDDTGRKYPSFYKIAFPSIMDK